MPESTRYVVELELRSVGDYIAQQALGRTAGKTKGVDDAVTKLRGNIKNFVSESGSGVERIGRAFDWTAQKVMGVAKWTAVAAGGALFAGVTYGVAGLNAELEKAQVSLGTIFNAQGLAQDVPRGITMARDVIGDMRKDAAKLPGEFSDLMNIFTTGAIPAFQAGMDPDSWRKLSSKVMAAGVVGQVPLDQAAREMTQLMQGRSGAHNVFGMKLMGLSGDKAEAFNKLDQGKRIEVLSKELDKYAGGIDAFSKTYEAASSTTIDHLKEFGLKATEPVFERVTGTLNEINQWFDANEAKIGVWADRAGETLGHAWDEGREALEEWGPVIIDFSKELYEGIGEVWHEIEPSVHRFGEALKEALKDPGTVDKLITLAKLYVGAKTAGAVGGFALGSVNDIGHSVFALREISMLMRSIKAGGGLSGALGLLSGAAPLLSTVGGAGTATAGAGGVAAGGAAAAGGAVAGAGVAATAGLAALFAAGAYGWYYTVTEAGNTLDAWTAHMNADDQARATYAVETAESQHKVRAGTADQLEQLRQEVQLRGAGLVLLEDNIALNQQTNQDLDNFIAATESATASLQGLSGSWGWLKSHLGMGGNEKQDAQNAAVDKYAGSWLGASAEYLEKRQDAKLDAYGDALNDASKAAIYNLTRGKLSNEQTEEYNRKKNAQAAVRRGGGGGGTTQNFYMTITSNKDPSRIAREVRDQFEKSARMPTRSPGAQKFSGLEKDYGV